MLSIRRTRDSNLTASRLIFLSESCSLHAIFEILIEGADAFGERLEVWPHRGHHFRVKKDADVVNDGCDLEGTEAWQNLVARVVLVIVREKLAVLFLLVPRLGHSVRHTLGLRHERQQLSYAFVEVLRVLASFMHGMPSMRLAVTTYFEHEHQLGSLLVLHHRHSFKI